MKKWTLAFVFIAILSATAGAQQVKPFKDANNKWGVKNNEVVVVTPQYDFVDKFSDGLAVVLMDNKFGAIDTSGKIVVPLGKYTFVNWFTEGLASVISENKFGFIDTSGKEVIPPKFDFAGSFSEGLATAETKGLSGFIDKSGKVIIPFKYGMCYNFHEGLAVVGVGGKNEDGLYLDGKFGVINRSGKEIVSPKYDYIGSFSGGVAEVNIGGEWTYDEYDVPVVYGGDWGAIDKTGKEVIPLNYEYVLIGNSSQYGYIVLQANNKFGIANTAGTLLTPVKYDFIKPSSSPEIALVNIGGKYDDVWGDLAFNPYTGGSQGFINYKTGKEITPVQYATVSDFNEGLAMVNMGAVYDGTGYNGGKCGYIDTTGKTVIPLKFDTADYFFEGKAKVSLDGREFYIDKTGKEVK